MLYMYFRATDVIPNSITNPYLGNIPKGPLNHEFLCCVASYVFRCGNTNTERKLHHRPCERHPYQKLRGNQYKVLLKEINKK